MSWCTVIKWHSYSFCVVAGSVKDMKCESSKAIGIVLDALVLMRLARAYSPLGQPHSVPTSYHCLQLYAYLPPSTHRPRYTPTRFLRSGWCLVRGSGHDLDTFTNPAQPY